MRGNLADIRNSKYEISQLRYLRRRKSVLELEKKKKKKKKTKWKVSVALRSEKFASRARLSHFSE